MNIVILLLMLITCVCSIASNHDIKLELTIIKLSITLLDTLYHGTIVYTPCVHYVYVYMCCVYSIIELIIIVFIGKLVKTDIKISERLMEIKMPLFFKKM